MSHNDMSINAFKMLSEGLALNTRLTDFFFTHNNLADAAEGGVALIQALKNKTDLKSLALNSCNLTSELLAELDDSIKNHISLKELYLFANRIDSSGAAHISSMIKNKT